MGTLRDLAVGPDHRLLFVPASGRELVTYFADGTKCRSALDREDKATGQRVPPDVALAMVDSHGQTWALDTKGTLMVLDRNGLALKGGGTLTSPPALAPNRMTPTADGCMGISYPDSHQFLRLEKTKGKWAVTLKDGHDYSDNRRAMAVPARSGAFLVLAGEGDKELGIRHQGQGFATVPLPEDTACVDLVQGPGDTMLFAASGPGGHHVGLLRPGKDAKGTLDTFLVAGAGPGRTLRSIAPGPGGRVWYVDEGGRTGSARTPEQRLAALGIALPAGPLDHIVRVHGEITDPARSQFRAAHSTAEGVTRLLAEGLEDCGEIARIRSWSLAGRWLTPCRMAASVGWFNTTRDKAEVTGKWLETDLFVVVTEESPDDGSQTVVTAYPEHPRGI